MKVLVYGNRKQNDIIIDASTPEKCCAALLALFHYLDAEWKVYQGLEGGEEALYLRAKEGDAQAAMKLLGMRRSYEYEAFHYGEVVQAQEVK